MLGAILGDIIGSPYEFDMNNIKTTDFLLFSKRSEFTDDTIMTIAVAQGLMNGYGDREKTAAEIVKSMQTLGRKYPNAGYGINFNSWLYEGKPKPYNSFGNGSAMCVSSVAWLYNNIRDIEEFAEISANVTHNHPEGIKGAKATAVTIFLARQGADKDYIREYIGDKYQYRLNRTCDEIRPYYHNMESCQETVPEAITAFLEGNSFEDVIRLAVSLGGDSDTLAAIAGSIAEAYYPISEELRIKAVSMLDYDLKTILNRYRSFLKDIRAKQYKHFERVISCETFFDKKEKTEWYAPPPKGEIHYFAHPCYCEDVSILEDFAQNNEFTDFEYDKTIENFGLRMDLDLYREKAASCCPLALRAMLTSIVRQERFCDGLIAEAIEKGTISAILGSYKRQMKPPIL